MVDTLGGPVGKDLDDAGRLLDAIVSAVEQRLAATEQRQEVDVAKSQAIEADLAVAERLSRELGEQVNQVAQLRQQQAARRDLDAVAATARKVRAALEQNDRERQRVLASFSVATDRLQRLADRERDVRELQARCTRQDPPGAAPRRALGGRARRRPRPGAGRRPAVEGGAGPDRAVRRQARPRRAGARRGRARASPHRWPSVTTCAACSTASAARPGAHGFSEDPSIEPLYRQARELLWAAPCDLDAARPLVGQYVAGVNARLASGGGQLAVKCTQPFCTGTIVDGYCDVCGMAPSAQAAAAPLPPPARRRRATAAPTATGSRPGRRRAGRR